eukprot:4182874-Alexandrium_andersonii.AAC.1
MLASARRSLRTRATCHLLQRAVLASFRPLAARAGELARRQPAVHAGRAARRGARLLAAPPRAPASEATQ